MPRPHPIIYLASQSSRRQVLLSDLKISFKTVLSTYRERWCRRTAPELLCIRHAVGKVCKAILPRRARFILGGDTIVWYRGHGLGKPRSRAEALHILRRLSGKKHVVYTGLAILDRRTGRLLTGCARTDVWMKLVGEAWVQKYVDTVYPFDKAGAYAIQAHPKIVRKIRGSYSNVVGLPKELLQKMLKEISKRSDVSKR